MHESIRLGTIRGIAIGLNWSVLAIAALLAFGLAEGYLPDASPGYSGVTYWTFGIVAVVLFFGSLLAHELSHSIVAQGQGVVVEGITLWLFGGVAKLRNEAADPTAELKIATAGPAMSLALTAGFGGLALFLDTFGGPELLVDTLAWLALINGMLAIFNLAPAAPLDGGRILHALVWRSTHDRNRATRVATSGGRVFGYLLIALGIFMFFGGYVGGLWFALIGWFVIAAAGAEATHALLHGALSGLRVRDVMTPNPITVPASDSLETLLHDGFLRHHCSAFPVLDDSGHVVGLVTFSRLKRVPAPQRAQHTTGEIAIPFDRLVVTQPDASLVDVLEHIGPDAGGEGRMLVFDDGRLVGIVSPTDLNRAIQLASLRTEDPRSRA